MRTMLAVLFAASVPTAAHANHVYTQSNAADGNEVLVFEVADGKSLTLVSRVATGGYGNDAALGSQGSVTRSGDRLFVVNAGSNDVSEFVIGERGLRLETRVASGGTMPISVAARGENVYVLDGGGDGDVSHFRRRGDKLTLVGTTPLANRAPSPAEVAISPSGDVVVVTEKATNCVDTFVLDGNGKPGAAVCHASAGSTPFGFAFAPARDVFGNSYDRLVVSEAAGGAANASTVSSYVVTPRDVAVVSPAVATHETAACWIALADDGRFAYTTDAGSGTVSAFSLAADGSLSLLASVGDTGDGSHPIDEAVAGDALFVLDSGTQAISAFALHHGNLAPAATTPGLPPFAAGLATD
jgi:6-phosphogluconolactonase